MSIRESNDSPRHHTMTSLRLEITSVHVSTTATDDRKKIHYQGVIEFPSDDRRRGVTGLFLKTEVRGSLTPTAWYQLQSFHDQLCTHKARARGSVEIVASKAVLLQPRVWVSETRFGVTANTILKIRVEQVESARIPGHRWRSLVQPLQNFPATSVKDESHFSSGERYAIQQTTLLH